MKRIILIAVASAVIGALIAVLVLRRESPGEDAGAPTEAAAQQTVKIENGEPTITLDVETQKKIGIVTAALTAATTAEEVQAFGSVADVKELADFANQHATARAQAEQATSKATFDERQLQRLRGLNADNHNVSDRAVQEAAANVAGDNAQMAAANAAMQGARAAVVQRFGNTIADALINGSALYQSLAGMHAVLIELAMPAGVAAPRVVRVANGDGTDTEATLVSNAPRVDPKLQGRTFFYVAPAAKLSAGMNVAARIPTARGVPRVAVPPDAVVSWQGRSWIYVRRTAGKFARVDAALAKNGDEVVTTGAQQLLGEEMRSQLHED